MIDTTSPRNWSEDFPHENGNYMNRCLDCEQEFIGHKRRHVCKVCALRAELAQARADLAVAMGALSKAAKQFRFYEDQHAAKGSLDGDAKARTNAEFAEFCEQQAATLDTRARLIMEVVDAAKAFTDPLYEAEVIFRGHSNDYVKIEMPLALYHRFRQALSNLTRPDGDARG